MQRVSPASLTLLLPLRPAATALPPVSNSPQTDLLALSEPNCSFPRVRRPFALQEVRLRESEEGGWGGGAEARQGGRVGLIAEQTPTGQELQVTPQPCVHPAEQSSQFPHCRRGCPLWSGGRALLPPAGEALQAHQSVFQSLVMKDALFLPHLQISIFFFFFLLFKVKVFDVFLFQAQHPGGAV